MEEGGGPFRRGRLMGYHGQLSCSLDTGTAVANTVALAPGVLFAPVTALADQTTAALTDLGLPVTAAATDAMLRSATALHSSKGLCQPQAVSDTTSEIEMLKSEIAGVQCALAYMKGADEISTLGKKLGRRLTQDQLRKRADLVTRSLNELPLSQYIKMQHSCASIQTCSSPQRRLSAAPQQQPLSTSCGGAPPRMHGNVNSPNNKAGCLGSSTMGSPHRPVSAKQQQGAPQCYHGALQSYHGSSSEGGARLLSLTQPATEKCKNAERNAWSAGGAAPVTDTAASVASQRGFDSLTADPEASTKWRRHRPIVPVGKGEAVILEAALDEALPAGALTAKYTQPAHALITTVKQHTVSTMSGSSTSALSTTDLLASSGPAQVLLASQDMRTDWQMLDSVMREAARQVAASCAERGRLLLKVGERYGEAFDCLSALMAALHASNTALATALATEQATTAQLRETLHLKVEELAAKQSALEERDFQIAALKAELEHSKWDHQQEVAALKQQNQILADRLTEAETALEQERLNSEETLARIKEALEAQIASLTDERDDLLGRVRFLQRQVAALRHGDNSGPTSTNAVIQTEPVQWFSDDEEDEEDGNLDATNAFSTLSSLPAKAVKRKRRPRDWLGGFEGLVSSNRQGRIRGLQWTQAAITQIYADKIVQDAIADRDVRPRPRFCEFILDWHLNKYGLVQLAEANVLDLIASTRHHAKNITRINWFAQFIGLQELALGVSDTTQHLSFYLFLLQQLAFPNSLACLFPDHPDTPPADYDVTSLPEVTKAVFRYINDPDQVNSFMAQVVEPLTNFDPTNHAPTTVPLDALIRVYMTEYQQRYGRATSHLTSLFQAGDTDLDGLIDYNTLTALVDVAAPDAPERLKAGIYSEAMRALPAGHHLIPCAVWLNVTRTFGFDRWKLDPTAFAAQLKQAISPSQLLAQGPGVLPLLSALPPGASKDAGSTSIATIRHQRHESTSSGPLISRLDSTRQINRSVWGVLLSSLRDLEPSLPTLVEAALQAVPSHSSLVTLLKERASHFSRSLAALPASKGSPAIESVLMGLADLGCSGEQPAQDDLEVAPLAATTAPSTAKRGHSVHAGGGVKGGSQTVPATPNTTRRAATAATATTARGSTAAGQRNADLRSSMGTGMLTAGSQAGRSTVSPYWETRQVLTATHSPADAPQAWLAFQLLFMAIKEALSTPARPASPLPPGCFSPGSRPGSPAQPAGSPARRRHIIMPAMPWRNGRLSPVAPIPASSVMGGRGSRTVSVSSSGAAAMALPESTGKTGTGRHQEPVPALVPSAAVPTLDLAGTAAPLQGHAGVVAGAAGRAADAPGIIDEVSRAYLGTRMSDLAQDGDKERQARSDADTAAVTTTPAGQDFTGFPLMP